MFLDEILIEAKLSKAQIRREMEEFEKAGRKAGAKITFNEDPKKMISPANQVTAKFKDGIEISYSVFASGASGTPVRNVMVRKGRKLIQQYKPLTVGEVLKFLERDSISEASLAAWNNEDVVYDGEKVGHIEQVHLGNRKYKYILTWDKDFKKKSGVYGKTYTNQQKAVQDAFKQIRNSERFGKLKRSMNEGIFRNYTKMLPADARKLTDAWLRKDKNNRAGKDKDGYIYGYVKGSKEAIWKYVEEDFRVYSDMSDREIWRIVRGR
jgi:hypothetical protein